ncbi:MAG TPA: biotin/lipoyl-containing protein, partial [Actinomycetota bacterium]|nr:biotin/lipoyl-containing protein [Actinomycetota bacterium]
VSLSKACGYVNAGTVELLVDEDGSFFFLEVNARLQVEHTVTEEIVGLDLVACQLQIASGDALGFTQEDVESHMYGHAIECRINAEDPARGFLPTPGVLTRYVESNGLGVRVDSGYTTGDQVPDAYDSLVAKLITRANDREEARVRMLRALSEFEIQGITTTIPALEILLNEPSFVAGTHTTRTVESGVLDTLVTEQVQEQQDVDVLMVNGTPVSLWDPGMSKSASAATHGSVVAGGEIVAPMQGTILKVVVDEGAIVSVGDPILVLEAMKMETTIAATRAGTVTEVRVAGGENVGAGQVLAVIEE